MGRPGALRRVPPALLAIGLLALHAAAPAAPPAPRLVRATPARAGDLLVCDVNTAGLPGEKLSLSMRSGLVSSVELVLDLMDERDRVRAGNRLTLRLAFDLWEEVFSVEEGGRRSRLADDTELASYLGALPRLPVAPLSALEPGGRYRVRVGLRLHAIAPGERERVEDAIAGGGGASVAGSGGRQEVSVSLGRLIRFFYRDDPGRPRPQSEIRSAWFRPEELSDAAP